MSIARQFIGYFISSGGVFALGALDSSLIFFLPLGVDAVVIALAARAHHHFWLPAVLATLGSLAGAAFTYAVGHAIGDRGLTWFIPENRFEAVRGRVREGVAYTALLALIPPPFPFTPVVLTSGALNASKRRFFTALAVARLARFGTAAWLARRFGQHITHWLDSGWFEAVAAVLVVIAIAGTVVSGVKIARAMRGGRGWQPKRVPAEIA